MSVGAKWPSGDRALCVTVESTAHLWELDLNVNKKYFLVLYLRFVIKKIEKRYTGNGLETTRLPVLFLFDILV